MDKIIKRTLRENIFYQKLYKKEENIFNILTRTNIIKNRSTIKIPLSSQCYNKSSS